MLTRKIILPILVLVLSGCASPATKEAMVVRPEVASFVKAEHKGKFKVVKVSGGKATNPMWTSQVSGENFESALVESLNTSGLAATDSTVDAYNVEAELLELDQPLMGLTFDVISKVNYRVYKDGFEKYFPITATGTATVSDAFVAIVRLKMANEKSIQENITAFIKQLAQASEVK